MIYEKDKRIHRHYFFEIMFLWLLLILICVITLVPNLLTIRVRHSGYILEPQINHENLNYY